MLEALDIFYTIVHLVIIGFNLFGWIWPATRKAHLACILLTAASWFLLGIWYGIGYCPVTDWQWEVKTKLGEQYLPASFVKYYADKITGRNISSSIIDTVTAVAFVFSLLMSFYVNFFRRKQVRTKK